MNPLLRGRRLALKEAESRQPPRRRINYQLGVLTDSLGKRTVNRQLARRREVLRSEEERSRLSRVTEQRCLGIGIPDTATGKGTEPGSFDVAVMRRGASVVLVVLAACLFGGARCGEKYWWMNQGSHLRFSSSGTTV